MPLSNRLCFQVNLRDRLQCQSCGAKPTVKETYHRGFEYHHIIARSQCGLDTLDNIVLLCHACHHQSHQKNTQLWKSLLKSITILYCNECGFELNTETVEMNCGWYRCNHCQEIIHLFDHYFSN